MNETTPLFPATQLAVLPAQLALLPELESLPQFAAQPSGLPVCDTPTGWVGVAFKTLYNVCMSDGDALKKHQETGDAACALLSKLYNAAFAAGLVSQTQRPRTIIVPLATLDLWSRFIVLACFDGTIDRTALEALPEFIEAKTADKNFTLVLGDSEQPMPNFL